MTRKTMQFAAAGVLAMTSVGAMAFQWSSWRTMSGSGAVVDAVGAGAE